MKKMLLFFCAFLYFCSCNPVDGPDVDKNRPKIPDVDGATVKGAVMCDGHGIQGVVVSDGKEVTITDADGFFWLKSSKKQGSVFVSFPSGYAPKNDGALPEFYQTVSASKGVETLWFDLEKLDTADCDLVVSTDHHLADRYSSADITAYKQFFVEGLKSYAGSTSRKVYGLVLGDMTWDIFWDTFSLQRYKAMAKQFPIPTFHAIGNHDYDMSVTDDFKAAAKFRANLGPTWYSFNLGGNHVVVMDDIVYRNENQSRNHDTYVDDEQLEWLEKDLSYVPKDVRVLVAMHCTVFRVNDITSQGKLSIGFSFDSAKKARDLLNILNGREVHFITGDTHVNQSMTPTETGYEKVYEHNVAAVCSSYWWTWYLSKNHICRDGSRGGFLVMSMDGGKLSWRYKGLDCDFDTQFSCYDMNEVKSLIRKSPDFAAFYNHYPSRERYTTIPDNSVMVNVWNWDPTWKVTVTENGKSLPVTWRYTEDPLHTLSYDAPRTADNGEFTSSFGTVKTHHIFTVKASGPDTTLEIEVQDSFGNVSRKTFNRPCEFTIDTK